MESIRNFMNLRTKEKEEHEYFKKEEPEQLVILSQDYQPDMNSLKTIKQKN